MVSSIYQPAAGRGPTVCVLSFLPSDSEACKDFRTTAVSKISDSQSELSGEFGEHVDMKAASQTNEVRISGMEPVSTFQRSWGISNEQ